MNSQTPDEIYTQTLGTTANLVYQLSTGKIGEDKFVAEAFAIAQQVEIIFPKEMVLDMLDSWKKVMLNQMDLNDYFIKWKISEDQFWDHYE